MYAVLSSLLVAVLEFFGSNAAKTALRVAFAVAVIAFMGLTATNAYNTYTDLLQSLDMSVPAIYSKVWNWVMPSNAKQCFFIIMSATTIRFGLDLKMKYIALRAKLLKL